jgi:Zn-dependent protease
MIPAEAPPGTSPPGTLPLFTFRGIRVSLHWSWAFVALWQIESRRGYYPHVGWDILQYVCLFAIVLLHEFGHSFATRQVGGTANQILLWPFGGIAYVKTPPRPKAYLWAIIAGPLVNVVLWPVFYALASLYGDPLSFKTFRALHHGSEFFGLFLYELFFINTILIIFNLLPIYPTDGGQIFRGLLWLKLGPLKSMFIAAWTGLILGAAAILFVLIAWQSYWTALMVGLMLQQSWATIQGVNAWRKQNGGRW